MPPPASSSTITSKRFPFLVIYATVFLDLMGFGIVLPLLPFHVESFGVAGLGVGVTLTAYSAAQFIAAPVLGRLSDRFGRRPLIVVTLMGSAVALTVSGLADNLPLLIASRALAGVFGGSIAPAQAYVADLTAPGERAKHMGLLGASIGLGFILGPAIGAALSPLGFATVAYVAAGLSFANFWFALGRLPESLTHRVSTGSQGLRTGFLGALRDRNSARVLGSTFLTMFAFVGMEATFALLGKAHFDLTNTTFGLLIAFVGLVAAATQITLVGRLSRGIGERWMGIAGALLLAAGIVGLPFAQSMSQAAFLLGVLAVGEGLLAPALITLNSLYAERHSQGAVLGLGQSFSAAARALGPITAGWLFEADVRTPYLLSAALAMAAVALLLTLRGAVAARQAP